MAFLGIPGLDGYRAAVQDTQARDANQIGLLGGVMNLQNAMFEHQLTPLKVEQLRLAVDAARTNQAIKSRIAGGLLNPTGPQPSGPLPGGPLTQEPAVPWLNQQPGVLGAPPSGGGMFAPAPQGANGLPADIQAALLSGDPGLSAWAKEQAKTFAPTERQRDARVLGYAPGTPEYNAFVGTQYNQGGAWIPDGKGGIMLAPGYAAGMGSIKGAEAQAAARYAPPVTLNLPGQRDPITMRQDQASEFLGGQNPNAQSGATRLQAPNRESAINIAQQLDAQGGPFSVDVGNYRPTMEQRAPGVVTKQPPTQGENTLDNEFAKDWAAYKAGGGFSDVQKQLGQLQGATETLKTKNVTGPILGLIPDAIKAFTNPEAIDTRDRVLETTQRNLRAVLGAQFTQKEGEMLMARAYNPSLPESVNLRRVTALIEQIDKAARAKEDAGRYFEANGTLRGWGGKLPTMSDFDNIGRETQRGGATGGWSIQKVND